MTKIAFLDTETVGLDTDRHDVWEIGLIARELGAPPHARPARTARGWRTPVEGDVGFPDLALARRGRLVLAELKSASGRLTQPQQRWQEEHSCGWHVKTQGHAADCAAGGG